MQRVASWVVLVGLGGAGACVRTMPPTSEPSLAGDEEQAVLPGESDAPLVRDPCTDRDGLVIDRLEPIVSEWQGAVTVGGHGPVMVRWCGAGAVTVASVTVSSPEGARFVRELDPAAAGLEAGASLAVEVSAPARAQRLEVVVLATDEEGRSHSASAPLQSAEDPELVTQRDACEAAGGQWGAHGMLGRQSCDRPTHDAGQRCTSSADCESFCVEDGDEPLTGSPPVGVEEPRCGAGQQPRLLVGHCHERSLPFGCHPRLREVTIECIAPGAARRGHMLCVD